MSQKANYFKLGLFVIGAVVAGVAVLMIIGAGRWLKPRVSDGNLFQRVGAGARHRLEDEVPRCRHRRGDADQLHLRQVRTGQADEPAQALRARRSANRAAAGRGRAANDIASPESSRIEVERGLRVHLAPQGITGTNYLELDYVDSLPAPVLPIDWVPDSIYIPSTPSTVATFVSAATEIIDRLHRLDIETTVANLNRLLLTAQTASRVSIPRPSRRMPLPLHSAPRRHLPGSTRR